MTGSRRAGGALPLLRPLCATPKAPPSSLHALQGERKLFRGAGRLSAEKCWSDRSIFEGLFIGCPHAWQAREAGGLSPVPSAAPPRAPNPPTPRSHPPTHPTHPTHPHPTCLQNGRRHQQAQRPAARAQLPRSSLPSCAGPALGEARSARRAAPLACPPRGSRPAAHACCPEGAAPWPPARRRCLPGVGPGVRLSQAQAQGVPPGVLLKGSAALACQVVPAPRVRCGRKALQQRCPAHMDATSLQSSPSSGVAGGQSECWLLLLAPQLGVEHEWAAPGCSHMHSNGGVSTCRHKRLTRPMQTCRWTDSQAADRQGSVCLGGRS